MSAHREKLKLIVSSLPDKPGIYQYLNAQNEIIYVGKAKNLKRRVSSYFNKNHDSPKVNILVRNIRDIKYIVVNSEEDALLLENNLIKQHQPRYNVLLKDGKTYPWLCITKEYYPRVFKTRQMFRGADYFGPYPSTYTIDVLLELIRELYPIRTCKLPLTPQNIEAGKYKVCLQYHIHNCLGCCENLISIPEYGKMIHEIKEIAKGNSQAILDYLFENMKRLASEMKFEEAQALKDKYDALSNYQKKTVITTMHDDDLEVYGYEEDESAAYINVLKIAKGSIVQGYTIEYQKKLDEPKEEILALAIVELREKLNTSCKTIIVPFTPDIELKSVEWIIPQRGDKKKLLDLSIKNVRQYKIDKLKQAEKLNPDQRAIKLLTEIQQKLGLKNLPQTIECFDNSNISGSDAVAACVVFKKAKPSKKDYRKYIIKSVTGPDDYASMQEVVRRRYTRMLDEGTPLPDLIITDGGKGQMEVVRQVIQDELHLDIPIAGLSKDNKHRTSELLFGFPPKVVGLKPTDFAFKFLASIQDEVHRFAITFHRDKRSKSQTKSELDDIVGIGEKSKVELLKKFKSLKRVREATLSDLEPILGKHKAKLLFDYFETQRKS